MIDRLDVHSSTKTVGMTGLCSYLNETVTDQHQTALRPTIVSEDGASFRTTKGDAYVEAPLLSGPYTQHAVGGKSVLGSADLHHTTNVERTTYSLSNPVVSLADGAPLGPTLKSQVPLVGTLEQLAQAHDTADLAEGAVKSAYQAYQTMTELKAARNLQNYGMGKLSRVGFGSSETTEHKTATTTVTPQVLTNTDVTLISEDDDVVAIGLSGNPHNLTFKAKGNIIHKAPIEQSHTTTEMDGMDLSLGITKNNVSVNVGHTHGQCRESHVVHAHQPLNVTGKTTFAADGDIHILTPFRTRESHIEGRRLFAETPQDHHDVTGSSFQGSFGVTMGAQGITPSGSFSGQLHEGSRRVAPTPTVVTSTKDSYIKAYDKVVLRGAGFVTHGTGSFSTPITETYDVVDSDDSDAFRFGAEFSFGSTVPGFVEVGTRSASTSATHRPTIGRAYKVEGSAGSSNRDESTMTIQGPRTSSHFWFGTPIVTPWAQPTKTIESLADLADAKGYDGDAYVEEIQHELENAQDELVAAETKALKKIQKLADQGHDLVVDALYTNASDPYQEILLDLAQDRQDIIQNAKETVQHKTHDMTLGKFAELVGLTVVGTLNEFVDSLSWFPSPAGLISATAASGRDIITDKTSLGEFAVDSAIGFGLIKGVGYTVKGIKSVVKKGADLFKTPKPANTNRPYLPFSRHTMGDTPLGNTGKYNKWTTATISDDLVLVHSHGYETGRKTFTLDPKAPFNVLAHGNAHKIYVHIEDIHPKGLSQDNLTFLLLNGAVSLDVAQAARLIKTAPGYTGQPINIMACKSGEQVYGFAQRLATRMDVTVSAFTTKVQVLKGGHFSAIDIKTGKQGILKTFYPQK